MTGMKVNIIGAGLAGMSAALELAKNGIESNLISSQASERAQSVLAEGGINAALDQMGEGDTVEAHYDDTMWAGCYIADSEAVRGLVEAAPGIVQELERLGVPFNRVDGHIAQRHFGGQQLMRTAYARSSSGKAITGAVIDEVRKYENLGMIHRFDSHELVELILDDIGRRCLGVIVRNTYMDAAIEFRGPVILAFGGMNGMFPCLTTGTTANTGDALAKVFTQGVKLSNLEMIQFHPTTVGISGKRMLVSEAARGEGGRLYVLREKDGPDGSSVDSEKWYYMEEKYPELGNLMPRDVVTRESYYATHDPSCGDQVYLDLTGLTDDIWQDRLPDMRDEIMHYLGIDPADTPVPVEPGIHYFMGGIDVDTGHHTNIRDLYAAGECCSQYHGANRLGANSMLAAIYGGRVAAGSVAEIAGEDDVSDAVDARGVDLPEGKCDEADPAVIAEVADILADAMAIARDHDAMQNGLDALADIPAENEAEQARVYLAEAMILSAMYRKESRGAHYRTDFTDTNDEFKGLTTALLADGRLQIGMK